jgi:hypothetical protein
MAMTTEPGFIFDEMHWLIKIFGEIWRARQESNLRPHA